MEAKRESCPIRELQNLEAGLGLPGAPQHAIAQQDICLPAWCIWCWAAKADTTRDSANAAVTMVFICVS
jgi:hypothetical protein